MLRKLLPDYPEDVIRRSLQYQYRKPINTYSVTISEIELLNRINGHHSRWTYSRQPFTKIDELVRVSEFLPFYEYLRHGYKSLVSTPPNNSGHTLRQLLPQTQTQPRSSEFMNGMPSILRGQGTIVYPPTTDFSRENMLSTLRPIVSAPILSRPLRPQKTVPNPYVTLLPPQSIPSNNTPTFINTGKDLMIS
jgi:hypothetical protein